jgi:uncharacterized membrane protein
LERIQRNIVAGVFVVIPIMITYWITRLAVDFLANAGRPMVTALAGTVQPTFPEVAEMLLSEGFQWVAAILFALAFLYVLGALTTRVLGRRLLALFDRLLHRIPFVKTVYGATRKLVDSFQQAPAGQQRVVLIEFPSPEMKTIGLVTRIFNDIETGRELAAVYVPTAPNPTSGYMEIVPVDRLVWLDWSTQEAMQFVLSGGTVAPDAIDYGFNTGSGATPSDRALHGVAPVHRDRRAGEEIGRARA